MLLLFKNLRHLLNFLELLTIEKLTNLITSKNKQQQHIKNKNLTIFTFKSTNKNSNSNAIFFFLKKKESNIFTNRSLPNIQILQGYYRGPDLSIFNNILFIMASKKKEGT